MQVGVVHLENSQRGFFFKLVTCLMRQGCELARITFHQALIFDYLFTNTRFTFIIQFVFIQKHICNITKVENFFLAFVMTYILQCLSLSYELQILEFQTLIISLAFAPHHLSFYFKVCLHETMHVGKDLQKCNISCVLCFVPFHKVINSKPQTSIS
jgi:hypothetical protein